MTSLRLCTLYGSTFLHLFSLIWASTHWVVTEDGRIQSQVDSVYNLKRPHDLVALLKQEERLSRLRQLKDDLVAKRDYIDRSDDKDSGLEQRFYKEDKDCVAAEKPLPEYDLYISTVLPLENKGIKTEEHINLANLLAVTNPVPPLCGEIQELDFSMDAFEHLEGMQRRRNLTGAPELGLKNAMANREQVDNYGHIVNDALMQNRTSWVLYNLAAFYWRIKGNSYEATECLRRALHYSPRSHKDVALISLANVLHRSRYSNEAAIVVGAALDISWDLNVNHFTLGNILSVLTQYDKAIECYENTLKIQPDFHAAAKRRHAVLCHAKLEAALEEQHRSLQQTLEELKDYQKKHETMQQMNEKLLMEQAPPEDRQASNAAFEEMSRRRAQQGMQGEVCHVDEVDGEQVVNCAWEISPSAESDEEKNEQHEAEEAAAAADIASRGNGTAEGAEEGIQRTVPRGVAQNDYSVPSQPPLYKARAEELAQRTDEAEPAVATDDDAITYKNKSWPSKEECERSVVKYPQWTERPTTYLPLENKGFDTQALLTEAIDLEQGDEHSLPWYPPICLGLVEQEHVNTTWDHLSAIKDLEKLPHRSKDAPMKDVLLSWVNNGASTIEEVGQRIFTALKLSVAPRWLLYNLAGLYWRVVGNMYHGVECLRRSLRLAPPEYVDLPLVNLANVLYKLGKLDDAINLTEQALAVAEYEPITHFMLANLLAAKGNDSGAVAHYERALALDGGLTDALDQLRIAKCYNKFQKATLNETPKDTCANSGDSKVKDSAVVTDGVCGVAASKACEVTARYVVPMCSNRAALQVDDNGFAYATLLNQGRSTSNIQYLRSDDMETVQELYRQNGLCKGNECDHIVHQPGTRPHIKLYVNDGVWNQRLLFTNTAGELGIKRNECYLLSDGIRTEGCAQEPFTLHEEKLRQLEDVLKELNGFVTSQEVAMLEGQVDVDDEASMYSHVASPDCSGDSCQRYAQCHTEESLHAAGGCQLVP